MQLPLYNQNGETVGTLDVSDAIFGLPLNRDLLHRVITGQLANTRRVIAHAKGRHEVRGGGKKPWAQKGTGRARHGSIRSPIWKGGGVTHGPTKEKKYEQKINQKVAQKALAVALSAKVRDGQLAVIDTIALEQQKTKAMASVLRSIARAIGAIKASNVLARMLVVIPSVQTAGELYRAGRNIPSVDFAQAADLNALKIISSKHIIFLKESIQRIEKQLQGKHHEA